MAQHDYDIANDTAANVRADLNDVLAAIVSNNSGASEPSTTYANQWWYDSSNDILKIRNEADTAWIEVGYVDQTNELFRIGYEQEPQLFTSSGTYTPSDGAKYALVELQGAGGAGGGGRAFSGDSGSGCGGNSGAYASFVVDLSNLTGNPTLVVGAGGTGANGDPGGDGGDTSYDDTGVGGSTNITAGGGSGGGALSNIGAEQMLSQPSGGSVTETSGTAYVKTRGQPGGFAIVLDGSGGTADVLGGAGAQSRFGGGGRSQTGSNAGENAQGYGAGGGGASLAGTTNNAGGDGGGGIIKITEFF